MTKTTEVTTSDEFAYSFYDFVGVINFQIKAASDCHVALCTVAKRKPPICEIIIGGWHNTKSVIRKDYEIKASFELKEIISNNEFRHFWILYKDSLVRVGWKNEEMPFMQWMDGAHTQYPVFGIATGEGYVGSWIIHNHPQYPWMDEIIADSEN